MSHMIACDVEGCSCVAVLPDVEDLPEGWRYVEYCVEEEPDIEDQQAKVVAKHLLPGLAAAIEFAEEGRKPEMVVAHAHVCSRHDMPKLKGSTMAAMVVPAGVRAPDWVSEVLAKEESSEKKKT